MKNHYLLVATVSFALIAISGCTSQRENMIKQGYPLPYVDGFDDGCHSGKKAGGNMFDQFKKDVAHLRSFIIYKSLIYCYHQIFTLKTLLKSIVFFFSLQ
jgi:hypothetical protein